MDPQPPVAQRVASDCGHLRRWPSSTMRKHRLRLSALQLPAIRRNEAHLTFTTGC